MKQRENRNKKEFRNSIIYNSINKSRSIILYINFCIYFKSILKNRIYYVINN